MTYNPRIFIRDFGNPDYRMLAYTDQFDMGLLDAALKRDLIMHAENPSQGEELLLLSGDEQSGADVMLVGGADELVLSDPAVIRLFGPDVVLTYSVVTVLESGVFTFTGGDVGLIRSLVLPATTEAFVASLQTVGFRRDLVMPAEAADYTLLGVDADLKLGNILAADPASYTFNGVAAALLRQLPVVANAASFTFSGQLAGLTATRRLTAAAGTFTLTGHEVTLTFSSVGMANGYWGWVITDQDIVLPSKARGGRAAGIKLVFGD